MAGDRRRGGLDSGRGVDVGASGVPGRVVKSGRRVATARAPGSARPGGVVARPGPRPAAPRHALASLAPRPMVDRGQREALESVRLEAVAEPVAPARGVDLSVALVPSRDLLLANPILVASGTFGYGIEYGDVVEVQRLGAICCKGTTLKPRIGNP